VADTKNDDLRKLIEGCIGKIEKSKEMLYKQFFGYALSVAMLYNNNRNDAIEVVDDSFMKVFLVIHTFDIDQPFKPWLRKIVINTSIDRFRKTYKKISIENDFLPVVPDNTPGIISQLTSQDILRLVNQLPNIQKIVFGLYEIEGFSHDEIATKLNIPESSSRVYLTRAKKKLRELFRIYFNTQHEKFGN
jgi:RNA polymerase sigma factor (sigma-70 family)